MSDVILCCDVCYSASKYAIPLVADASGIAWCPRCGKQWEEVASAKEVKVPATDTDTVG